MTDEEIEKLSEDFAYQVLCTVCKEDKRCYCTEYKNRKAGYFSGFKAGREEQKEFVERIVKASADNPQEFFEVEKENADLKQQIERLEIEIGNLKKSMTQTRTDRCIKKHLTSDMTKKEFPAVPCYVANNCWLCNIYEEANDEQH